MNRDKRGEELSILENRPTNMLQFAQGLWTIGSFDCCTLYTLRSAGAQELDAFAYYRHIAPLERKTKPINLNRKPMDFQH